MITVEQATKIVLENTAEFGEEMVSLAQSPGRVLCETLFADKDFPPFNRVSMDGIAIRFEAFETGRRIFPIEGIQAAGAPQKSLQNPGNCLEVMTGAVLPENTDSVIRYEDIEIQNGQASIAIDGVRYRQNIHLQGTDCKKGALLVAPPCKISAAEIGVAATIGKTHLQVARRPKTVIISTGDELVEVSETPLPHQIRKSNVYQIQAALQQWGLPADTLHLNDDKVEIQSKLSDCLEQYDVLLLSGAVSKGKFDYVPEVLETLGVTQLFHKVEQRPGKPFWFGKAEKRAFVFAFPGNPVSSFMCTHRYFRPWWRASSGLAPFERLYAVLASDFEFKPKLTYFLQVRITHQKDGTSLARPVKGKGSGDLANMLKADGFVELPQGRTNFKKGDVFPLILYR